MSLLASAGRDIFRLGYEISPIILTGGIAINFPGQMLPVVAVTESASVITGFLNGTIPDDLDRYFAHFQVVTGSTLISNQIGEYPFANQQVAANAIISQPLNVSLMMTCPVQQSGGYPAKLATFTALQAILSQHNNAGGLYIVATPAFLYTNCIMVGLTEAGTTDSAQVQIQYQFDFEQPLVTVSAGQQAYSALLSKITGGTMIAGQPTWSGPVAAGASQLSGAAPSAIYGANSLTGIQAGSP